MLFAHPAALLRVQAKFARVLPIADMGPLFHLPIDEPSHWSLVRNQPAEINLDLDNLAIPHRHYSVFRKGFPVERWPS
jgi:hypothetical protein